MNGNIFEKILACAVKPEIGCDKYKIHLFLGLYCSQGGFEDVKGHFYVQIFNATSSCLNMQREFPGNGLSVS